MRSPLMSPQYLTRPGKAVEDSPLLGRIVSLRAGEECFPSRRDGLGLYRSAAPEVFGSGPINR